jgi:hypothetical protein
MPAAAGAGRMPELADAGKWTPMVRGWPHFANYYRLLPRHLFPWPGDGGAIRLQQRVAAPCRSGRNPMSSISSILASTYASSTNTSSTTVAKSTASTSTIQSMVSEAVTLSSKARIISLLDSSSDGTSTSAVDIFNSLVEAQSTSSSSSDSSTTTDVTTDMTTDSTDSTDSTSSSSDSTSTSSYLEEYLSSLDDSTSSLISSLSTYA